MRRGGKAFDDENLDLLSHLLDDFIRIPGTSIRFGLDGSSASSRESATAQAARLLHHHRGGLGARRAHR